MNCREIHADWENDPCAAVNLRPDSAELAEHIASCAECNDFIETRRELAKCLSAVRESAPAIPPSLDDSVVARYRGFLSQNAQSPMPVHPAGRFSFREFLELALAVAFAITVAYGAMVLLVPHRRSWVDRQAMVRQPVTTPQTATITPKRVAGAQESARKQRTSLEAPIKLRNHPASVARHNSSVPTSFQSLMYCDSISCPGAMEVIRVELPSPVLGVMPVSARPNAVISADVLVGPDGIARGIRIVE